MTESAASEIPVARPLVRQPTHPGMLMREILEDAVGLSVAQAAQRMGITRQALHAVLSGRARVSPAVALRFGRLVNAPPELYLRMQENHDLWQARQDLREALAAIEPVPAAE